MLVIIRRGIAVIPVSVMLLIAPGVFADVTPPPKQAVEAVERASRDAAAESSHLADEAIERYRERSVQPEARAGRRIEAARNKAKEAKENIERGNNYPLETGMERTGFKYDRPNIIVSHDETRIPTVHVTMKMRLFKYPYPSTCVVGKTKVLKTRVEWKNKHIGLGIKTKVPVVSGWWDTTEIRAPCLKTGEIKTKVPEFKAGHTTIRLPQVAVEWETVEASFHLPQFTIRDYPEQLNDAEDELSKAEEQLDRELATIHDAEVRRFTKEAAGAIKERFKQARAEIEAVDREAKQPFMTAIDEAETAKRRIDREIRAAGAKASEANGPKAYIDGQIAMLRRHLKTIERQIAGVLERLHQAEEAALEQALGGGLAQPKEEV